MQTVTFSFDLGDYSATYTGRVEGILNHILKVKYFEPTIRDFVSIDLRKDQVLSRNYSDRRMLPLAPVIREHEARPFIAQSVKCA